MRIVSLSLVGLCLAVFAGPAPAAASYDGCTETIKSLPAVITTQGTWCLESDFSTSMATGSAITIAANNITIDCNGHKLGGISAGTSTLATGIGATGRLNATVRDCTIRGFAWGVNLGGFGHLVEDSTFDVNRIAGIQVVGGDAVIRRNRIVNTGGHAVSTAASAITVTGTSDIVDNSIVGVATVDGLTAATGIFQAAGPGGTVARNRIHLTAAQPMSIGIMSFGSGPVSLLGNDVLGAGSGSGIICTAGAVLASRNVVTGFDTPAIDCEDAGDNDFVPPGS